MRRTADTTRPRCIVCNGLIAKRFKIVWFRFSQPAFDHGPFGKSDAIPDGTWHENTVYLDNPPKTAEEAQRFCNYPIVRIIGTYKDRISGAEYWDGESYMDEFFCKQRCARRQGYASAHYGARFKWKET